MSKEFDKLRRQAKQDRKVALARRKEAYQYARSLGFPFEMARRLMGSSKERILCLSKELKK